MNAAVAVDVYAALLLAQGASRGQQTSDCCGGMMGPGMWGGMLLFGALIVAAIAALVALIVFLIRRSRPQGPQRV